MFSVMTGRISKMHTHRFILDTNHQLWELLDCEAFSASELAEEFGCSIEELQTIDDFPVEDNNSSNHTILPAMHLLIEEPFEFDAEDMLYLSRGTTPAYLEHFGH